jgi:quercetin dioxygenase-like cupin family protein
MNTPAQFHLDRRSVLGTLAASSFALMIPPALAKETHAMTADSAWVSALGLQMKVEVPTAATGGAMSATRVISPPGGGPPAHVHTREDEVFLILRGHYRFWQKGQPTIEAPAGTLVQQHKGMVHQYRNVSNVEGEHILFCLPGGLEELFISIANEGLVVPRDMKRVIDLSAQYGISYQPSIAE